MESRFDVGGRRAARSSVPTWILSGLVLALSAGLPQLASAACQPSFRKISLNGLGDNNNAVVWAMVQFKGKLYVGTANRVTGTEVHSWDPVTETWTQVNADGFGSASNEITREMAVYKGRLYAGLVNSPQGAEIWRTQDGVNWEQVVSGGFGVPTAEAIGDLTVFQGYLYAGVEDGGVDGIGPGLLWRTKDGAAGTWEPMILDGLGDVDNDAFQRSERLKGFLYHAVRHTVNGPPQLWRTENASTWRQVVGPDAATPAGFGIPGLQLFYDLIAFKGNLYVGTANYFGFSLHRSVNGINWQTVGTDGMGTPGNGEAGPSNPGNIFARRFEIFEDKLWMAIFNYQGARLWKSQNGVAWTEMVGPAGLEPAGFGEFWNWGIRTLENFNDRLYIGTAQCFATGCIGAVTGASVWEFSGEDCEFLPGGAQN